MDIAIAILTAITAVASCAAAFASWYGVTSNERHLRKIQKQKADIVLLPRVEYRCVSPSKLTMDMQSTDCLKYFAGDCFILPIDDKIYFGGNVDMSVYSPYSVRNWMMATKYFEIGYVTGQGKKKWKSVHRRRDTSGSFDV